MMLPASCGVVACLYFLCLLVGLPLWASAAVILAGVAVLCWWLSGLAKRVFKENVPQLHPVAVAAFLICLYWLATGAAETAAKHGGWDAMAIWNFHARYLADGHLWRNLFLNTDTEHPDYPLCLPSLVGFLFRLGGGTGQPVISYMVGYLCTLLVPLLLFFYLAPRNTVVALVVLFVLSTDAFYLSSGVSGYADTLLGLFFLVALMAWEQAPQQPVFSAVAYFFLICGAWTKNEGVILACLFTLFHIASFRNRSTILYALAGAALPAVCWLINKVICPAHNDMVVGLTAALPHRITEWDRYTLIYQYLCQNVTQKFGYMRFAVLGYTAFLMVKKQWPERNLLLLSACLLVYLSSYILTPHDPEWHLSTSQDRLLLQLMPAILYVIGGKLSDVKLEL